MSKIITSQGGAAAVAPAAPTAAGQTPEWHEAIRGKGACHAGRLAHAPEMGRAKWASTAIKQISMETDQ